MHLIYFLQENINKINHEPAFGRVEESINTGVQFLKLTIETIGALIIGIGVLIALVYFVRALIPPRVESYNKIRLVLARYLALALEFQLGADILSTAIAPSWDQIGKLGAIAVIRTALNYFLSLEMKEERTVDTTSEDNAHRSLIPPAADTKANEPK